MPLWQEVATKIGNLGGFVAKKMATKPPVLIGVKGSIETTHSRRLIGIQGSLLSFVTFESHRHLYT